MVDFVRGAVHLVPHKRLLPAELLRLALFSFKLQAAQRARVTVEEYSGQQLEQEELQLSRDQTVAVQSMSPQVGH